MLSSLRRGTIRRGGGENIINSYTYISKEEGREGSSICKEKGKGGGKKELKVRIREKGKDRPCADPAYAYFVTSIQEKGRIKEEETTFICNDGEVLGKGGRKPLGTAPPRAFLF